MFSKIINVLIILILIIVVISLKKLITNFVSNILIVVISIRNVSQLVKLPLIFIVILCLKYNVLFKINNLLVLGQMDSVRILMIHLVHLLMDFIHLMFATNSKIVFMDSLSKGQDFVIRIQILSL